MAVLINIAVIVLLAYSSYIDIKERRVNNKICVCIAAFVVLIIALFGGIGGGDVKLIAALSLCLGLEGAIIMLFCAAADMLIFYRIIKLIKGEKASKYLPFVPFITLGYITVFLLLI